MYVSAYMKKNNNHSFLYCMDKMKKTKRKNVPPSSYDTMPYYFPTEQVDNVGKLKLRQAKIRKRKK
jgi:hypothetical protein